MNQFPRRDNAKMTWWPLIFNRFCHSVIPDGGVTEAEGRAATCFPEMNGQLLGHKSKGTRVGNDRVDC